MAEVRAFRRRSSLDKTFFSVGFLIPVVLVLCTALVYVHFKVETIKLGYDISANKKQEEEALRENFALQAKFMELKAPPRIEYLASGLGFKFPTQKDVIYIKENTIVGDRK